MKYIDLENWERKEHFQFFHRMDYPQFNICMNIDVTHFLKFVKEKEISFYYAMVFAAALAANEITNFRYRIRGSKVVLHSVLHPSFTDMSEGSDLFKFVTVAMKEDIIQFARHAKEVSAKQEKYFAFEEVAGRDDFLYITCIPWIEFTHISHTISLNKDDSVPRISWGKYFKDKDKVLLPFSVQVNHALVDGVHIGQYVSKLQSYIDSL